MFQHAKALLWLVCFNFSYSINKIHFMYDLFPSELTFLLVFFFLHTYFFSNFNTLFAIAFVLILFNSFQVGLSGTFRMYPFVLHSISMSIFASVIGPFGGFFASGFKRAFKIKVFCVYYCKNTVHSHCISTSSLQQTKKFCYFFQSLLGIYLLQFILISLY